MLPNLNQIRKIIVITANKRAKELFVYLFELEKPSFQISLEFAIWSKYLKFAKQLHCGIWFFAKVSTGFACSSEKKRKKKMFWEKLNKSNLAIFIVFFT